eukprot:6210560-Pleurochrysis_carterae.AAC.1
MARVKSGECTIRPTEAIASALHAAAISSTSGSAERERGRPAMAAGDAGAEQITPRPPSA